MIPLSFVILLSDIRYMLLLCLSADSIFSPLYNLFLFVIPYCPLGCGYESFPVCSRYNLQYLESDFPLRTDTCDRQSIPVIMTRIELVFSKLLPSPVLTVTLHDSYTVVYRFNTLNIYSIMSGVI